MDTSFDYIFDPVPTTEELKTLFKRDATELFLLDHSYHHQPLPNKLADIRALRDKLAYYFINPSLGGNEKYIAFQDEKEVRSLLRDSFLSISNVVDEDGKNVFDVKLLRESVHCILNSYKTSIGIKQTIPIIQQVPAVRVGTIAPTDTTLSSDLLSSETTSSPVTKAKIMINYHLTLDEVICKLRDREPTIMTKQEAIDYCYNELSPVIVKIKQDFYITRQTSLDRSAVTSNNYMSKYRKYMFKYEYYLEGSDKVRVGRLDILDEVIDYDVRFRYDRIVTLPYHHGVEDDPISKYASNGDRCYNSFPGFEAKLLKKEQIDHSKLKLLLDHFRLVWCNDNEHTYKALLSYFHQMIANGSNKTEIILLLNSGQGCGKSRIMQLLIKHMFGKSLGLSVDDLYSITQEKNEYLMNKMLVLATDINNLRSVNTTKWNLIKGFTDSIDVLIRPLYIPGFNTNNIMNMIFCGNDVRKTIHIEKDDRRYWVLDVSAKYKNDRSYFGPLFSSMEVEGFYDHLMSYFYYYDDLVNIHEVAKNSNSTRQAIIDASKEPHELFVDELLEGNLDFTCKEDIPWKINKDKPAEVFIPGDSLWTMFNHWLSVEGVPSKSTRADIYNSLLEKGYRRLQREMPNGKSQRGVAIPSISIENIQKPSWVRTQEPPIARSGGV